MNNALVEALNGLDFFKNGTRTCTYTPETVQVNNYMLHVLYDDTESPDVINSIMVLRGGYREPGEGTQPGYVMITSKNCIIKYDVDESKVVLSYAADGDRDGQVVDFDGTVDEAMFFQESLLTDLRGITYDFIAATRDMVQVVNELEKNKSL